MATMPAFFRKTVSAPAPGPEPVRAARDLFQLRALPHEDIFFFSKKIDNSRLVREADPQTGRRCLSAVGGACVLLVFMGAALAPNLANTLAGIRLEKLKLEEGRLLDQRRALVLREAELSSPQALDRLARQRGLMVPVAGQVFHLEPKGDGAVAMVKREAEYHEGQHGGASTALARRDRSPLERGHFPETDFLAGDPSPVLRRNSVASTGKRG